MLLGGQGDLLVERILYPPTTHLSYHIIKSTQTLQLQSGQTQPTQLSTHPATGLLPDTTMLNNNKSHQNG